MLDKRIFWETIGCSLETVVCKLSFMWCLFMIQTCTQNEYQYSKWLHKRNEGIRQNVLYCQWLATDENNAFMLDELFVRSRTRPLKGWTWFKETTFNYIYAVCLNWKKVFVFVTIHCPRTWKRVGSGSIPYPSYRAVIMYIVLSSLHHFISVIVKVFFIKYFLWIVFFYVLHKSSTLWC